MSQNDLPITMPTIQKILQRISTAERSQQKEIRITIQEARDLTLEMAALTSRLSSTVQEIHQMLSSIQNNAEKIDVKFDGGTF
jgi:signal transduction histidine kinase